MRRWWALAILPVTALAGCAGGATPAAPSTAPTAIAPASSAAPAAPTTSTPATPNAAQLRKDAIAFAQAAVSYKVSGTGKRPDGTTYVASVEGPTGTPIARYQQKFDPSGAVAEFTQLQGACYIKANAVWWKDMLGATITGGDPAKTTYKLTNEVCTDKLPNGGIPSYTKALVDEQVGDTSAWTVAPTTIDGKDVWAIAYNNAAGKIMYVSQERDHRLVRIENRTEGSVTDYSAWNAVSAITIPPGPIVNG